MKIKASFNKKARIEMLPLIDIVFLLLVFFIYAMLSMVVHHGVMVDLPESTMAKIEKKPVISVSVKKNGSIYIDKDLVPINEVSLNLKGRARGSKSQGVLLFADKGVIYQVLFQVIDRIKEAGITRISLQAVKKAE